MALLHSENFDTYTNGQALNSLSGGVGWGGAWANGYNNSLGATITNSTSYSTNNSLRLDVVGPEITRPFGNLSTTTVAFSVAVKQTAGNTNQLLVGLRAIVSGTTYTPLLAVQVAGSTGLYGSAPYEIILRLDSTTILTGVTVNNTWAKVDLETNTTNGQFRGRVNGGTWTAYSTSSTGVGAVYNGVYAKIGGYDQPTYIDSIAVYDTAFVGGASATATTNVATNVTYNTANANATVNGNGFAVNSYIELGTSTGVYGSQTAMSLVSGTSYTANLTGLSANTTYYFRVKADNGNGISYGAEQSFITLPTPIVTTSTASSITINSAQLNATANNSNTTGTYLFDYGTTNGGPYPSSTVSTAFTASVSPQNVGTSVSGLTTGTTYYYRAKIIVGGVTYTGTQQSFVPVAAPTVSTENATALANSVSVSGLIVANGIATTGRFNYGLTPALGTFTPVQNMGNGNVSVSIVETITGLSQNTLYYYQAQATNVNGTNQGVVKTFTTAGSPFVKLQEPTKLNNLWLLGADINPNTQATTVYFEHGPTTAFGSVTTSKVLGASTVFSNVSDTLPDISAYSSYYWRVVATSAFGATVSSTQNFNPQSVIRVFAPQITVKNSLSNIVNIANTLQYGVSTYLSRDVAATTNVFVENSNYIITPGKYLVGAIGAENAEIASITSITLPTSAVPSQVTFSNTLVNRHQRGEKLSYITFDQIELSSSTTENGVYSVVNTVNVQANNQNTFYHDTAGLSTTFYKARFKNSLTGDYSAYSVPVSSSTAQSSNTAAYLINSVKSQIGIEDTDPKITDVFLLGALNDARRIVDREFGTGKMKEWRANFEFPIKLLSGANYVALPSDVDYVETNRSLLNVRYAQSQLSIAVPLIYVDKKDWNNISSQNRNTYNISAISIGATSIVMSSTGDLPQAGAITFQSSTYTNTPITVTYTSNNVDTNTLSGVTGVSRIIPTKSQAWVVTALNYPRAYTVYDGKIFFDSPIPVRLNGVNVYIDYYKAYEDLSSLKDTLPEHYADIYKNYLRFAIKRRRDDTIGENDVDYIRFKKAAENVFANDYIAQEIRIK